VGEIQSVESKHGPKVVGKTLTTTLGFAHLGALTLRRRIAPARYGMLGRILKTSCRQGKATL